MSTEGIAICSICLLTFGSHEEVLGHTCNEIKEERIEVDEMVLDEKDDSSENKPNISENDSDYSPENIKSKKNRLKKKGTKKKRPKKHEPEIKIKVETNKYQDDEQNDLIDSSNLELSEQFAAFILSQVDELCEIIKNGDPDLKRTMDVNQKLNDAVDCYRKMSVQLLNFKEGGSLKARFLAKNQHTQRKPLYFENMGSTSLSKIGHDFRK